MKYFWQPKVGGRKPDFKCEGDGDSCGRKRVRQLEDVSFPCDSCVGGACE